MFFSLLTVVKEDGEIEIKKHGTGPAESEEAVCVQRVVGQWRFAATGHAEFLSIPLWLGSSAAPAQ